MKRKVLISVDVDGTLMSNKDPKTIEANQRVVDGVNWLALGFKNTRIMVWSGQGKDYAQNTINRFGIKHAFAADKKDPATWVCGAPDIAIDDIHTFTLGTINLIVREK